MRRRRFKVDSLGGGRACVSGPEAIHALRVLRLGIGDGVVLFDGAGREVDGRIEAVSTEGFEVEPIGAIRTRRAPRRSLTIAAATPKGRRADWMIEKCAELGVRAVWLLETERGPVVPGAGKVERWRRMAVAAAKQAGRARVMEVAAPSAIAGLGDVSKTFASVFYGDLSGEATPLMDALRVEGAEKGFSAQREAQREILIFIGPEGGFTDDECEEIERLGGRPVSLGDATLRIETAAIAAAAMWAQAGE